MNWIQKKGSITIKEISQKLNISKVTARKDIDNLQSKGLVIRTHGGAVKKEIGTSFEPIYNEKKKKNHKCKAAIGKAAAELVKDGETLIIDSGSTSYEITNYLKHKKDLTIYTYDLMIAINLSRNSNLDVYITGGKVRNNLYTTRGAETNKKFSELYVNRLFLSVDALDLENGISSATDEGSYIKKEIIKSSNEVVLIADHSKFGKRAMAHVARLDVVDKIITDEYLDEEYYQKIKGLNIPIKLVKIDK